MPVWLQIVLGCAGSVLLMLRITFSFVRGLEKRVDKHELSLYGVDGKNGYSSRIAMLETDAKSVDGRIATASHEVITTVQEQLGRKRSR